MSAKPGTAGNATSLQWTLNEAQIETLEAGIRSQILRILPVLAALLILQALLISITFPVSELWTQTPLFHNDGAFHWYEIKVGVNLAKQGKLNGYDPFFNAGY